MNRLSFGIQSFDDGCLQRLGRIHDSQEADSAVKLAQDAGYDNIHQNYPFSVLGHRVHERTPTAFGGRMLHFGWQAYWSSARYFFGL